MPEARTRCRKPFTETEAAKVELRTRLHTDMLIGRRCRLSRCRCARDLSDADYDRARNSDISPSKHAFPALKRDGLPVSEKVGSAPAEGFAKITHQVPMLSLGNAFSDEDVADFVARGKKFFEREAGLTLAFHRRTQDRWP